MELEDETLAFAEQMFDLAREGVAVRLAGFVDAGLPVDLTNSKGDSLLLLAAHHSFPDTVRALLERGADPHRVNDRGQTPLAAAVFRRCDDNVRQLPAAGADPHLGDPDAPATARFYEPPDLLALLAPDVASPDRA